MADLIVDQAARLRRIDSSSESEWDSESGRALRDVANDLAGAVDKAEGRYRDVATALTSYATLLDGVQEEADRILGDANTAEDDLRRARAIVIEAPEGTPEYDEEKHDRLEAIDDAKEALRIAQGEIEALIGTGGAWHTANRAAADAIRAAISDEMADDFWDGIKQAIHDAREFLNFLRDVLAIIGTIIGAILLVAAIVAMFIPGVNLVVLAVIALVVAAAAFLITAAQWFAGGATDEELAFVTLDLVLSAIGLKGAMVAGNIARISNSTAHSVGQTARLAGGSYSAVFQAFKNPTWIVKALDGALSGAVTLVRVAAVSGPMAPVAALLFGPAVPFVVFGVAGTVEDGVSAPEAVSDFVDMMTDWDGYVAFRPTRWRVWVAWGHFIVVAVGVALLIGLNLYRGPIVLAFLGLLFYPSLMLLTLRPVRVVPGVRLERSRLFRRPLVVPGGASTDILYYADVAGSQWPIRPLGTPIGVVDQRWAVVRREKKVVMRFSMRLWSVETIDAIALKLGSTFDYRSAPIEPWQVAKRHPDYYWKIEQRPTLYLTLFIVALFAISLWILASCALPFILSQVWGIV